VLQYQGAYAAFFFSLVYLTRPYLGFVTMIGSAIILDRINHITHLHNPTDLLSQEIVGK
jgi:hypothetical protein